MITVYNGKTGEIPDPLNRGFLYGDGAFETMIFSKGKIRFLADHLLRIREALQVFRISIDLEEEAFQSRIQAIAGENKLKEARIKLYVWRKAGGLFEPESREGNWLITAEPLKPFISEKTNVRVIHEVRNSFSDLSPFKTLSSARYVLAGLKKKEYDAEDVIILDLAGNVSEALYSNIFWIKNGDVYTPGIETGCISGIMRKYVLSILREQSIGIREGNFPPEQLLQADFVFTSNVSGLCVIRSIGKHKFRDKHDLFDKLKERASF